MNRREAILAGVAGLSAAAAGASTAHAQAAPGTNPGSEYIRSLLRLHDGALTDHELNQVVERVAEKAVLMGTGPWAICSGPDGIQAAYDHLGTVFDTDQPPFAFQFRIGGLAPEIGWMIMVGNVIGKEGDKEQPLPFSLSLTVTRRLGGWQIMALQFAMLTSDQAPGSLRR